MLVKRKCHQDANVAKTQMSKKKVFAKTQMLPKRIWVTLTRSTKIQPECPTFFFFNTPIMQSTTGKVR